MAMPRSFANSTACSLSTFAPDSASSCVSSYASVPMRRAAETTRGSAVYTPSTSEPVSASSAPTAARLAPAGIARPVLRERQQVVGRVAHRRDDHDNVMSRLPGPHHTFGDLPKARDVCDAGAAVLLDDDGHLFPTLSITKARRPRSYTRW